ncbi:hypothetical protein [Larkinella sp. C7]|uniref:hypothetical protein n=1 Tax=Larkinella sp. C7 TaxID=2576607 RepID=UPI001485C5AE|nr:hypothetical protein [Larkinella sp. C7]
MSKETALQRVRNKVSHYQNRIDDLSTQLEAARAVLTELKDLKDMLEEEAKTPSSK